MHARIEDLLIAHDGQTLVDIAQLELERGRPVTVVGESGSGKSLLAHAVMGTLPGNLTAQGRLTVQGQSYDLADRANRSRLWGPVMALLPQEPVLALDPTMRVRDQVAEGAAAFRADRPSARRATSALLGALGLSRAANAFPHTLSGGMAQRVAFAAATIGGAPLLLADEPSKGLDQKARDELARLLGRHVSRGGLLLTITHDLDLARKLGGTVIVMKDARIVEEGPAQHVLTEPAQTYTQRLLAAEPRNWTHRWARRKRTPDAAGPVLVSAQGIAKSYGHRVLFSDLTMTIRAGQRTALTGPSGSGKTTLGRVLLRLLPADSGHVQHAPTLGRARLQKLYQDPALAFPTHVALADSLGDLIRRHRLDPARLSDLMCSLRLEPALLARRPNQVSGGELQRLAIIRAMLLEPALIFADEPTSRLDLITQEETMGCLMEQLNGQDCALVLVTHDAALADAVAADRVSLGSPEHPLMSTSAFAE